MLPGGCYQESYSAFGDPPAAPPVPAIGAPMSSFATKDSDNIWTLNETEATKAYEKIQKLLVLAEVPFASGVMATKGSDATGTEKADDPKLASNWVKAQQSAGRVVLFPVPAADSALSASQQIDAIVAIDATKKLDIATVSNIYSMAVLPPKSEMASYLIYGVGIVVVAGALYLLLKK